MSLRRLVLGLTALALAAGTASAQETAPWIELTIVDVAPGRTEDFLAAQRELAAIDQANGGPAWRRVSRTAVFGDTYRFLIATPLQSFASLDARAAGAPARAGAINRIQGAITGRRTYAVRTLPGIDNPLPEGETPAVMVVQIVTVAPGREADYLRLMLEEVLPHFDEAEMHHTTGALTFGGEGGYIHTYYVDGFAGLDAGSPVARALGAEGAQAVTGQMTDLVTRSEQWIVRPVPDLSYEADK